MFTDRVVFEIKAGSGGDGIIAWRREKYLPKGGPSGGDGGSGGSIVFESDTQLFSLQDFRHIRFIHAEDGQSGRGGLCHGKNGESHQLKVPLGTVIRNAETGEILYDFTKDKEQFRAAKGGCGGRGNNHFKSPTNQSPYECTKGREGECLKVELELKLIADVGLVGFPNAGKSTLLSQIAKVDLKCAPYPFTTLYPFIAPLMIDYSKRLILADIPGIIEGAHQNRGLGLEFLRHIERTSVLLFVIDIAGSEGRNPEEDFRILLSELAAYNPKLLEKPRLFALNKIDEEGAPENAVAFRKSFSLDPATCFEMSALIGEGVQPLVEYLKNNIQSKFSLHS